MRAFELALLLQVGGGHIADSSGATTSVTTGSIALDARYRFLPDEPWNVYALGGLAVVSATGPMPSSEAKRGRGALRLGVGVERRFKQFAFEAELRGEAVGKNQPIPDPPGTPSYALEQNGGLGLQLVAGVSYYF